MDENRDRPLENNINKPNLATYESKLENKEFFESMMDKDMPKKKEQDFTRDYAITLNLGQELEKKYKAQETESKGKDGEELVNIRLRQLGLAKLLVKIHGRDAQIQIKSNTHVGHAYQEYKCYEQAYNHLIEALEMRKEFYGSNEFPQYHLYTLKLLAQTCQEGSKVKEAILFIEEGECICQNNETIGSEGRDYAQLLALKADFLYLNLKFEDAIECYEKVYETYAKFDGQKSEGCANCLKQIVKIHFQQGNFKEAIDYVEECIETFIECDAQSKNLQLHDQYYIKLEILNKNNEEVEDYDAKFLDCYEKIKEISVKMFGPKDKRSQKAFHNLVTVLGKHKFFDRALEVLNDLEFHEIAVYGEKSNNVAKTYKIKANVQLRLGDRERAKEYINKSIKLFDSLGNKSALTYAKELAKRILGGVNFD